MFRLYRMQVHSFIDKHAFDPKPRTRLIIRPIRIRHDVFKNIADWTLAIGGVHVTHQFYIGVNLQARNFSDVVGTGPPWSCARTTAGIDNDNEVEAGVG
jgi:hypothetical protein